MDPLLLRYAVVAFGALALVSALGIIGLTAAGKEAPATLAALALSCTGAIYGLLKAGPAEKKDPPPPSVS